MNNSTDTDRLILHGVLEPQHALVRECLSAGLFHTADIRNLNCGDGGQPATVTAHWYLVTAAFAEELEQAGAPVLRNEFGSWWGLVGEPPLVRHPVLRRLFGG